MAFCVNQSLIKLLNQDDDADGEEDGDSEIKRAQKDGIGEMFSVREEQVHFARIGIVSAILLEFDLDW